MLDFICYALSAWHFILNGGLLSHTESLLIFFFSWKEFLFDTWILLFLVNGKLLLWIYNLHFFPALNFYVNLLMAIYNDI